MHRAPQALLFSNRSDWKSVLSEERTATIRRGRKGYTPGLVMLCFKATCVMADIKAVKYTILSEVKEQDYQAAGYSSLLGMITDIKKHYPHIGKDDKVTIIHFERVRGVFLDNYANQMRYT